MIARQPTSRGSTDHERVEGRAEAGRVRKRSRVVSRDATPLHHSNGETMSNFPLVRGGRIPPAALRWLAEVERVFPGATKDMIIVRNPESATARGGCGENRDRAR
jgi:hypothetical protein